MIKIIEPVPVLDTGLEFFALERVFNGRWVKAYVRHKSEGLRDLATNRLEFSKIPFDVFRAETQPVSLINAKVVKEVTKFKLIKGDLS